MTETTETVEIPETPAPETTETEAIQNDPLADVLNNAFEEVTGFDGIDTSAEEETVTPQDESTQTTEETSSDESNENTEVNDESFIVKTKVGEKETQWDLRNEEEKKKLQNRLQQLEHAENKFADAKKLKEENELFLNQQKQYYNANAMKYLFNAMQGKVQLVRPVYEDFSGKYETAERDREAFNQADAQYLETQKQLVNFETGYRNASTSFAKMISEFSTKHPEIEEPVKWVTEKMSPYYSALESFGMKPFPEDTAEMIYWWNNRSDYEESIREDERKQKAKPQKTTTKPTKVNVANKTQPKDVMDELTDRAFGDVKGFKT